jgi:hypothetical protein
MRQAAAPRLKAASPVAKSLVAQRKSSAAVLFWGKVVVMSV